jgi:Flp pilus assembly protein TadG
MVKKVFRKIMENGRNNRGQAAVETVIVAHILLIMFAGMALISTHIFDRKIILYACSIAINEAISIAPEQGITDAQIRARMKNRAETFARTSGLFLSNVQANPTVRIRDRRENGGATATFAITTTANYRWSLPFAEGLLSNEPISYTMEVDYIW